TAMKHYGLIVADNGSDWYFTGTEDPAWGGYDTMISELKTVPAGQFEAIDESGLMIDPNSGQARQPAPPPALAFTYLFPEFDKVDPGVVGDNVHIVNPDSSLTATGSVWLAGTLQTFSLAAGGATDLTFPAGSGGGPLIVGSNHRLLTSQRVQYH